MIHAYNEQFVGIIQPKVAAMFELAVLEEHIDIDVFAKKFISSPVCHALENADPVYALGKSANELLALILGNEPLNIETSSYASPEYWVGWVLSYAQWYFNKPYAAIIASIPCSQLLHNYFPYHEMDITQSIELIAKYLKPVCPLKEIRQKRGISQSQLANLSNVPLRTIKAYEQGTVDIAKAQAETLYALVQTLNCSIEDLIK